MKLNVSKAISSIFLLLAFIINTPVFAADTAAVTASVTVQNISVQVSDGTVSYGTMSVNTSKSTISGDLNDQQTANNNGNVTEDLNIRGQNSTTWTLASSAGADQYVHRFCTSSCDTPPTNYTALTTNYQTLATGLAQSGDQVFDLQLTTPTSSSSFTSEDVDVTVQAVAP